MNYYDAHKTKVEIENEIKLELKQHKEITITVVRHFPSKYIFSMDGKCNKIAILIIKCEPIE